MRCKKIDKSHSIYKDRGSQDREEGTYMIRKKGFEEKDSFKRIIS